MTKRGAARGQPSLRCCIFTDHRPHFIFIIRLRRHRSRDNSAQTTHSSKNSAVWVCPVHSPQTNGAILVFCKPPIRFICTFHTYQRFYITSVSDYMWVWAGCRVRRTYGGCGGWARDHCFTRCSHMCKPETTGPDLQTFSNRICGDRSRYFWEDIWKTCSWKPGTFGTFCMNHSDAATPETTVRRTFKRVLAWHRWYARRDRWTVSIANIYSCDWFDSICEHELLISYH